MIKTVEELIEKVKKRDPNEAQFLQAHEEVCLSLKPLFQKDPKYLKVMERLSEPERMIIFRVPWINDKGEIEINRGFRVQFNSAIGPYKGGIRFHPTVNLSIMKFLGFEQTFKNSLTMLPMGGGKGGSDFDPKDRSDNEVMRFCQSFMSELFRHVGQFTDVPAGDIGVGGREIGFMFGQFKRLTNEWNGTFTGKGFSYGGSLFRPEATGYGAVWFLEEILKTKKTDLKGKKVCVSGSGNVAQFAAELLIEMGAKVVTMSDSGGTIVEENGLTMEQLHYIFKLKNEKRGRIKEYCNFSKTAKFLAKQKPWGVHGDYAMPCACENEINLEDAKKLKDAGIQGVVEGANMPSTNDAVKYYFDNGMFYGPAKAANAGGVATSGLEMTQNSMRLQWTKEEVKEKLHQIMINIHKNCYDTSKKLGCEGNLQIGANAAGFLRVAEAMMLQGCV